ncbi:DUF4130 domain-containing protein [Methanocella sp. CWC-04]|uniref:DUF4130 domain-containing protein n=1 Tax=Methanooceanicella nereidis TaxID=2052831 RepID=A0AAP2W6Z1_9EURY|nr:DUF4130 domain-containing protein [Methanocella sp. CWC-04]MCD1295812.1 DUF4130 domain-containing protein [Methanocella sp. CWC-04]
MIIGYKKDMESVIKAAIALRTNPGSTMVCGNNKRDLERELYWHRGEIVVYVDDLVKNIPFHIRSSLWKQVPGCNPSLRGLSTGSFITYALRHRKCVTNELVGLLASYYPDLFNVLSHKDEVSKKYYHMYREVFGEYHSMKGFTRFQEKGDVYYVEVYPEHLIIDMYLDWIEKKNTDRPTVVKSHRDHYLVNAKYLGYNKTIVEISPEEAGRLATVTDIPSHDSLWETFYDSQYIDNRRNKEYAKKKIPAKYAYLSPDIKNERKKIERGIQRDTLDDFFNR